MGFAVRSRASRRPHIYPRPYYHCNILNSTFKMESSVRRLQSILDGNETTDQLVTYFRKTLTSHLDLFQTVPRQPASSVLGVFKSTSPMILCSSFNGLMAESYLLCLFLFRHGLPLAGLCVIQLYAHALCQQNHCYRYWRSPRSEYPD